MLEEAADELQRVQSHLPPSVRSDTAIGGRGLVIVARDNAVVADRHQESVRSKLVQRDAASARGLRMRPPATTPDRGVGQVQQTLALEDISELAPEDNRQCLNRYEEVGPRCQPAFSSSA